MVKILQVCPEYYPHIGGVETHVKEISERLVARGFDVEVATTSSHPDFQAEEIINGVKVRRFKSWAPGHAYYFSSALKHYLGKNCDSYEIVHAHNYHAFPALYAAQTKRKNKLIFTSHYHGTGHSFTRQLLHIPYHQIGRKIFQRVDALILVSNFEKKLVLKDFDIQAEKISVIPNGLNLSEFEDGLQEPKNFDSILYVGRLEKYKGIETLIRTLPKLNKSICLEIVGKGPFRDKLVKLSNDLSLQNRVHFSQNLSRDQLLRKHFSAGVFVSLSLHEAYGITVAEALAAGTPCVVVNESALTEWIDNKNCFGINYPIDTDSLVGALSGAIGRQVDKLNIPDWNEVVDRLTVLYKKILSL